LCGRHWYWFRCWCRWYWCRCWSNWWWRCYALAVFQFFWLNAQWQVATWHGIGRGPVAGAPAQAERITHDHTACILHVGAFRRCGLDVLGNRSVRWCGRRGLRECRTSKGSRDGQQRNKFLHIFLPFGGDIRRKTARRAIRGQNFTTQGRHARLPIAKQAIDF